MDFHRLCPIHFPCHKMRDLTNCYSSMKLYRCKGDLFHQTSTPLLNFNTAKPLFKLPEHSHIYSGLLHTVSHQLGIKQGERFDQTSVPLLNFTTAKPLYTSPENRWIWPKVSIYITRAANCVTIALISTHWWVASIKVN